MSGFDVDLAELWRVRSLLEGLGTEAGALNVSDALLASRQGLAETETAAAVADLALALSAAVASYAVATHGLADKSGASAEDYEAVDADTAASIRSLY